AGSSSLALGRTFVVRGSLRSTLCTPCIERYRRTVIGGRHHGALRQALAEDRHEVNDLRAAFLAICLFKPWLVNDVFVFLLFGLGQLLQRVRLLVLKLREVETSAGPI